MAAMKIGLVAYGGVDRGGRRDVIPALLNLIQRLARRHELHVFALAQDPEPSTYPLLGATVHNLASLPAPRGLGMLRSSRRLVQALRAAGPFDLLHAYMGVPAGAVAVTAGRWLGLPVVVTFDGNELVARPEIGYGLPVRARGKLILRLLARSAARITVCTAYMARLARGHGIEPLVVPFGIDPTAAAAAVATPGPPWRLLHVASLNPVKDQPTLLRALARVIEAEPRVHLDVVGADTLGGAIQQRCRAMHLSDHVTFHGSLAADEVWPFYQRAHLSLLPSRHEAAGVAVLEAGLCRIPTVGTDVGYVAEWAPQGAARAVPVGDDAALASAVLELLRDEALRLRLGEAAHQLARKHHADRTASELEAIYASVTGSRSSARAAG
jgi:glycosyltransferase involved in cell wall biosynthesis